MNHTHDTSESDHLREGLDIAIVGMAGRFPGAQNIAAFWENVRDGVESLSVLSDQDLVNAGVPDALRRDPNYVRVRGLMEGIDLFDAGFFGITPREAELMDPQQRLFLECAWEALEHAGYDPERFGGPIGVYAGSSSSGYLFNLFPRGVLLQSVADMAALLGVEKDSLSTRVSYKLNLEGPSLAVQTACSTSLVAVHLACQGLLAGECDMALAGGISISVPQNVGYLYQKGGIASPDGHCRAFDAQAQGTVGGSGVGLVLLKRLQDAQDDEDHILAVIRGSAINNDGARKVGYTAPRVEGQAKVIRAAQIAAEVDPRSIGYIEAHGTGTPMGDPIEMAALTQAFGAQTDHNNFCAIGSVKTNIGHLDAAAGVAGLMKAVLALSHKQIPPSLHFTNPNPEIDFSATPFFVNTVLREWTRNGTPRRAGVSSFGLGGTNAHVVLEEAPPQNRTASSRAWHLLPISARSASALDVATAHLRAHLAREERDTLADIAYTLQVGRRHFPHRRILWCKDRQDGTRILDGHEPSRLLTSQPVPSDRPVAFLFPGQGAQHIDMASELYREEPRFKEEVDRCVEIVRPLIGCDLREILYPERSAAEAMSARLNQTSITQPALFIIEYALAKLWMTWGVKPEAMIGHSIGEYVAACLSGVFSVEQALRLVVERGRLIQSLPPGSMLAVVLSEREIAAFQGRCNLAAVNGPRLSVLSGTPDEIDAAAAHLTEKGIAVRRLHVSHAFHSFMMDPILPAFKRVLELINFRTPTIPFLSNVSGRWISATEATDPNYWVRHLRQTVRFSNGLQELMNQSNRILLEVGPGETLSVLARRQLTESAASDSSQSSNALSIMSSLPHPQKRQPGQAHLWESLGKLWLAGAAVEWPHIHVGERRGRVPLPTYPFERQRYWVDAGRDHSWSPSSGGESGNSAQAVPSIVSRTNQGHERPALPTPYCAPQSDLEQQLVTMWQELLRIDHIGIHDSFFELGGESLVAVQLLSQIRTVFKQEVAPADFFAIPTVVGLSQILKSHQSGGIPASNTPPAVTPRAHSAETPLSYAQERLWFLDQLEAGSSFYHLSAALHIHGSLNTKAVTMAFDRIVTRHEILRTAFTVRDGRPVQVIESEGRVHVTITHLEDGQGQETIAQLAKDEARKPFQLSQSPLMRITLIKVRDQEHVLLITMHHIISDGWSLGVLMREFAAHYAGFLGGDSALLPPPTIQYADYAGWQRQWCSGEFLNRSLNYWKTKLEGRKPTLALPTDRPRPSAQSYRGATYRMALSPFLSESLRTLSHRNNTTLFTTLLAGFQILLSRYSGQEDFCLGTPMANRPRAEMEPVIGFFVNTVVLRSDLSGASSFLDLLARVRETVLGAQSNQEIPFEKLVEALQPLRDLSYSPIFQVMFSLDRDHLERVAVPGLEVSSLPIETQHTRFDLTLDMTESNGAVAGVWEYSTDLFDRDTIERMAGHYQRLLECIVADPARSLVELPLLTDDERHRAVIEWNATERDDLPSCCLHQLVEDQTRRTPDAIAIRFLDQALTYQDVNERADHLAGMLRAMGVGPDVMVGLCVERSPAMIIGMLGVLKAGAAYVPIDPEYPEARIALMVNDANLAVLLTQPHLLGFLSPSHASILHVDDQGRPLPGNLARLNGQPDQSNQPERPDQLAYVIYTSGSTGRPKGVMVTHRNAVNFLHAMRTSLSFGAHDRVLAVTSISFDIAVLELFLPLTTGATILLADRETSHDGEKLLALLHNSRATVMQATPATWRMLLQAGWAVTEQLKVLCGGEALFIDLADRLLQSGKELWNLYGPTETTVWSAAHRVRSAVSPILIGRPIANTEIYIVDPALQPVPVGVAGEIYIGGVGVARGYWSRPDLTSERFVPDPFGHRSGGRLYRTGDLGRWRTDGTIECLGRIDHQVKVRGYRIEPGEIESRLVEHPQITQAVVTVHEDGRGEKRLVGYVVSAEPVESGDLRDFLRDRLPEYMVPSLYLFLERFPLTPNGKVDRKALPLPGDAIQSGRTYEAPRTATETTLADIWREVLGAETVGIHDNFFELGGDSILSIQVISRVRQRGISITPRQLFQQQTIAELAGVVSQMPQSRDEDGADTEEFVLTPIQEWYFDLGPPNVHQWNQSLLLDLKRPLDPSIVTAVMDHLVVHHDALRLRFEQRNGRWVQRYAAKSDQAIVHVVDLSSVSAEEQRVALDREIDVWETSLNILAGPQLRVVYLKMGGAQPDKLLLIMHHLVTDGISWRILMEDFHRAYAQMVANEAVTFPAKSTSYARWARRLSDHVQSGALKQEVDYWLDPARLQVSPIPVDHPEGALTETVSDTIHFWMDEAETQALLHEVPSVYRTQINDVLLTALVRSLGAWSSRQEILIDLEGHGREDLFSDIDLSRTIGWFAGVSPILLSYAPEETLLESLKSIKEQLRRFPQGGIGHGLLRYLNAPGGIGERLAAYPASRIRFNYLGQMDHVLPEDSPFVPSIDAAGIDRDPQARLPYELDINSDVLGKRLHMSWTYSRARFQRATITGLAEAYLDTLKRLIQLCQSQEAGGYAPSDFPLSGLTQSDIDRLLENRRGIEDVYPLTPLQQGLLVHCLDAPDAGLYLEQLSCTLTGPCDHALFQQAVQETVARHAALRTAFVWEGVKEPLQIVHANTPFSIRIEDWRDLAPDAQHRRLGQVLERHRTEGFCLDSPPLIRPVLIRTSDDATCLIWTHHHLLMDGWCIALIFEEVFTRYRNLRRDRQTVCSPVRPYRNYLAWLREQDLGAAAQYWRRTLAGLTDPTPLPISPTPEGASVDAVEFDKRSIQLSATLTTSLVELTHRWQITLNTLMQGAWALLLSGYSGERDVMFGITVSGRPADLPDVETTVGLFLNTLPLRVQLPSDIQVKTWLQQLMAQNLEMREYEYTPLSQVHGWSEIAKGRPLFESLLVFENYPKGQGLSGAHDELMVADVTIDSRTHYPLTVDVTPGTTLSVGLSFDRSRFNLSTVEEMLAHFEQLLTSFARNPEQHISHVSMMTEAERRQVVVEWNATDADYSRDLCLHQLVDAQARRTPDGVAVRCDDQSITYRDLKERSDRLARILRSMGVGPEMFVGVFLERSLDMVVGILGILKAGGAYVPIDPQYPAERIAFLIQDASPILLLTQQALVDQVSGKADRIMCLDRAWPDVTTGAERDESYSLNVEQPAYLIYTSGSTGKPKGVAITHRSAVAFIEWALTVYSPKDLDGVLASTSLCFDLSIFELFSPLSCGGRVVIAENALAISTLPGRDQVTLINTVPSAIGELLRQGNIPPSVRTVNLAGEPLPAAIVDRLYATNHIDRVFDLYGPSEDTTYSTCALRRSSGPVTIGRPIANTQIYLLDRFHHPVPVGVPGELYIGGSGLARGYHNRPDLTADRFIPDSLGARPGGRLYRTGDLARFCPDGTIEYLGRLDHQVKIRGFRIELGEIEAQLTAYPAVRDAVLVAREDQPGHKRLVAYVTPASAPGLSDETLRTFLKQHLPEHMVPSSFVFLEQLPLTPNGKVDRKRLPVPDVEEQLTEQYVAPQTQTEQLLAGIWEGVLNVKRVGLHDNFFQLGGDSILSLQIVARATQVGLTLKPKHVFQHQTIAELSAVVGYESEVNATQGAVTGDVPLLPIQRWFFDQPLTNPHHWNVSVMAELRQPLNMAAMEEAIRFLSLHHDALRSRFIKEEDGWRQYIDEPSSSAIVHQVELSELNAEVRDSTLTGLATEWQASLDLTEGPLFRVVSFKLGQQQRDRLLFVFHHLVVDGVSCRILLEDLHHAYQQAIQGQTITLPAKTTSYQQWAERLQGLGQSDRLQQEAIHWKADQTSSATDLPVDNPTEARTVAVSTVWTGVLDQTTTKALLHDIPAASRTHIHEVLLAALAKTLSDWTGRRALSVDVEGHGREDLFPDIDLSRTVGWCTSLFPVRLNIPPACAAGDYIKTVKEQWRTIPQGGIGYGLLRYSNLSTSDSMRRMVHPTSDVSFNYLGQFDQAQEKDSLWTVEAESLGSERDPSNRQPYELDITAMVVEGRLRIAWTYSSARFRQATIDRLAHTFLQAIQDLSAQCLSSRGQSYTPSDFPLARLDHAAVEAISAEHPYMEDAYVLSPLQEGSFFTHGADADKDPYCDQAVCVLEGRVERPAFEAAWRTVAERHPALRTAFLWEKLARPIQVVLKDVSLAVEHEDWSELDASAQQSALTAMVAADRKKGFAFQQAPLVRLRLIRIAPERWYLFYSHHHILLDGWSIQVILRDVLTAYAAGISGNPLSMSPARPYRDYIAWLQRQDLVSAEQYWRRYLSGLTAATELELERPQVEKEMRTGLTYAEQDLALSQEDNAKIQAFARRHRLTLNTLMQGVWALLLHQYSGRDEVTFGTTVSGRPPELTGVETMVGLFINTLPVRVKLPMGGSIESWLQMLQQQQSEGRHYEYTPLSKIQGWSDLAPGQALFDTLLVFENFPLHEMAGGNAMDLQIRSLPLRIPAAGHFLTPGRNNYPLSLIVEPGTSLHVTICYARARFSHSAMARLLAQFRQVLEWVCAHPKTDLRTVPMVTASERQCVVETWNAATVAESTSSDVVTLFETQAQAYPDRVAVVYEGVRLTYRELDASANRVAEVLRLMGVGAGTRVGLCLERSVELVIGLWGILKAGGTYVPIEPTVPGDRLTFLLRNASVMIVLTQASVRMSLSQDVQHALPAVQWRDVTALMSASQKSPVADCRTSPLHPQQVAYLIYTSGSTGQPKGVAISHHALMCYVEGVLARLALSANADQWALVSTVAADLGHTILFGALCAGRTLHLLAADRGFHPEQMAAYMRQEHIDVLKITPSHLAGLLDATYPDQVLPKHCLILGGEALNWPLVERIHLLAPNCAVINHYGPTETTVGVLTHRIDLHNKQGETVPLGRPLWHSQAYILDRHLEPLPIGVPGELYLGGESLANGYQDQPALTAERFIPHPFQGRSGSRLYKTGDQARFREDGTIEFLGRRDQQIKLRGYRIELGEIEAQLRGQPGVREAVVVIREGTAGVRQLVAYLVPRVGSALQMDEVRSNLSRLLPDYMVPARFVELAALPLTANGKLDRAALPDPDQNRTADQGDAQPQNQTEAQLAAIWCDVLQRAAVGRHDNFFELGGDSILSLQIIARAHRQGLKLTPKQLFELPTIAALAAVAVRADASLPAQASAPVTGVVPLTPIQQWFVDAHHPNPHHWNQALLLEVRAPLEYPVLVQAVEALIRHHDALRLRLQHHDGRWEQVYVEAETHPICRHVPVVEPTQDWTATLEAVANETQRSVHLTEGPLLRVVYLDRGAEAGRLLLVAHHLVVDGVSWRVLVDDLQTAYRQLVAGRPCRLPAKTTSLKDWRSRLDTYAASAAIAAEQPYWEAVVARLATQPVVTPPDQRLDTATTVRVALTAAETQALLQDVPPVYRTEVNDLLLTALAQTLCRWNGQSAVCVELEGHGREDLFAGVDLTRTVGWFTTRFPVWLEPGTQGPGAAIQAIKGQLRQLPNKGIGYGILRYLSADDRVRARLTPPHPPAISFNYLGQLDSTFSQDSLFTLATESIGDSRDPQSKRFDCFTVNVHVADQQLRIDWTSPASDGSTGAPEIWAHHYVASLRALINHCAAPDAGETVAADFEDAGLTDDEFNDLLKEIG